MPHVTRLEELLAVLTAVTSFPVRVSPALQVETGQVSPLGKDALPLLLQLYEKDGQNPFITIPNIEKTEKGSTVVPPAPGLCLHM